MPVLDVSVLELCVYTLKDMIESSVADTLEWPHRIVLPVGDTPADVVRWFFLQSLLSLKIVDITRSPYWQVNYPH